jgi:hypothetical protein
MVNLDGKCISILLQVQYHTIFSAVLRQQKKSDVMTSFGLSARSAVYEEMVHIFSASEKVGHLT